KLASGTYEALVTARGFAPRRRAVQIPAGDDDKLVIKLGLEALTAEVTVTADIGLVQELDKTTQQVNVIDEEKLEARAPSVLVQAFREEPGLQLQRTSATIGAV